MKKSAIKDIFNGFRGHAETMHMPKNDSKSDDILCDSHEELKEKLSPEMFKLHRKFVDALESGHCAEIDFFFVEGFKLGLLIGIECMED